MWPLANSGAAPPSGFVVVGPPDDRRVALFGEALARLGRPPARVVSYVDLLAGRVGLPEVVQPGAVVRIESPGKDSVIERALLAAGAEVADEDEGGYDRITRQELARLPAERGRILPSRQWYLGLCAALRLVEQQLERCSCHRVMNSPADVAAMFDKRQCHERLSRHGIAVPRSPGLVRSYDELLGRMEQMRCPRVFVKPAHGSSAAGVIAFEVGGHRRQATTTVEMVRRDGEVRLYNSRRIRVYHEPGEITTLIDTVCRQRVHVEQWLPKAGIEGQTFDLRVVVIAGGARHAVVRMSRSPLTNLHLLNARGNLEAVVARMGAAAWDTARRTCEQAAKLFPGSLYMGIDLLISPDYRSHAILEVNAFGDLLPGVLSRGVDTYTAEVLALLGGEQAAGEGVPAR